MENIHPPVVKRGKLVTSGSSVVLTMPREWLNENNLKAGDEVMIVSNGDLKIVKMTKENVEKIRNKLTHAINSARDTSN